MDYKIPANKVEKTIIEKSVSLNNDRKIFHIEDIIQMPKNNPSGIYKKLDSDKRIYSQKYKNVFLYPSCYNGLISCDYFLRIMFETDTLFSTNVYTNVQIDFYEEDKNSNTNNTNNELFDVKNNLNMSTPIGGGNVIFNKPIGSKNAGINKNNNILSKSVNESNSNRININSNNNDNKINNNSDKNKNDMTDGFEAPPSIFNSDDKNK